MSSGHHYSSHELSSIHTAIAGRPQGMRRIEPRRDLMNLPKMRDRRRLQSTYVWKPCPACFRSCLGQHSRVSIPQHSFSAHAGHRVWTGVLHRGHQKHVPQASGRAPAHHQLRHPQRRRQRCVSGYPGRANLPGTVKRHYAGAHATEITGRSHARLYPLLPTKALLTALAISTIFTCQPELSYQRPRCHRSSSCRFQV